MVKINHGEQLRNTIQFAAASYLDEIPISVTGRVHQTMYLIL